VLGAQARHVPWSRTILYELHVCGFSKNHNGISEQIRGTFAALAHPAAICLWKGDHGVIGEIAMRITGSSDRAVRLLKA
jgi:pullulanase/glycogen debranching enzyme